MARDLPTGTVTFLFTDVEGSTRLLHELGDGYADVLAEHRRVLREAFTKHGGVEVDTQGDAFFVAFAKASDALAAAAAGHAALKSGPIRVRMGLHTGEPLITDEGYVGIDVHRAARIAAVGYGDQILVSQSTRELADNVSLRDLGEHRLKDLTAPERIYQLGDGDFPPLRSLDATNLPVAANHLLGREREVDELLTLLRDDCRLVTITGPGGTGKSRLALEVAGELVGEFSDGVFWVSLSGLADADFVRPQIAQTLGVRDDLPSHLQTKNVLLTVDNFEHVLPATGVLAELLGVARGLRLLVTSRAPLHVSGEHEFPLDPLQEDAAVTLFVQRAQAAGRVVDADATVERICRRLDGLPLAIELAAARTKLLGPGPLLERLEHALPLLTGGVRDAPERQRALRATIAWSYDLLDADAKRLFARVAVFAGTFSIEAAEQVCDAELDTLAALLDLSLLKPIGESRFLCLQTIQEYALEQLETTGEAPRMRQRHAEFFLELVKGASTRLHRGDAQTFTVVEFERDNVRAALAWLEQTGHDDAQLELVAAFGEFWTTRGDWREGLGWIDRTLRRTSPSPSAARRDALVAAQHLAGNLGELDAAEAYSRELLSICERMGDHRGMSMALAGLGLRHSILGDLEQAEELLTQAARHADAAGDEDDLASVTGNLADIALQYGDYERALGLTEEAVDLYRRLGNERGLGWTLYNVAVCCLYLERDAEAVSAATESLTLAAGSGEIETLILLFIAFGALAMRRGDPDSCAKLLGFADQLVTSSGFLVRGLEVDLYEQTLKEVADTLGEARFAAAAKAGAELSLEEAVAYATSNLD